MNVTYKGNNDGDTIFGGLIAKKCVHAGLTRVNADIDDDDRPDALAKWQYGISVHQVYAVKN